MNEKLKWMAIGAISTLGAIWLVREASEMTMEEARTTGRELPARTLEALREEGPGIVVRETITNLMAKVI